MPLNIFNNTDLDIHSFKIEMDKLVDKLLKDMNSKQNVNLMNREFGIDQVHKPLARTHEPP